METAKYPNNDDLERRAVDILNYLFDPAIIKAEIKKADKIPHHDGEIEIVDSKTRPVGKFNVQVKKMPDDFKDRYNDTPVELIEYSRRIEQPLIFIGVDNKAEKAYWIQIEPSMADRLKPDQKTFTLVFDTVQNVIEKGNNLYITKWTELIVERQQARADLPKLKHFIKETIGLESLSGDDRAAFQKYMERINQLLGGDFSSIKRVYLPNIWKLGMAVVDANPDWITYHYFSMAYGATTSEVVSLKGHKPTDFFEMPSKTYLSDILGDTSVRAFQTAAVRRSYFDAAKSADQFVLRFVEKALKERVFEPYGELLCTEELIVFLQRFGRAAGIAESPTYKLADINGGLREFLPVWYDLAVQTIFSGSGLPFIRLDSFDSLARSHQHEAIVSDKAVQDQIGKLSTPLTAAILTYRPVQMALKAVDHLLARGVTTISNPYKQYFDFEKGLDLNNLEYNVEVAVNNAGPAYREFVEGNELRGLSGTDYYGDTYSHWFVADPASWSDGWLSMTEYHLEDPSRTLPKTKYAREGAKDATFNREKREAEINGKTYKIVGYMSGHFDQFMGAKPLKNQLYSMLAQDIQERYGLTLPHRFSRSSND